MLSVIRDYFSIVKELVTPDAIYEGIENVPFDSLYQKGYRTILLDVDNTLLVYNELFMTLQKVNCIQRFKAAGFRVYLTSNNSSHRRIQRVSRQLEVFGIHFSLKPFVWSTRNFAKRMGFDLTRSIIIGDQLFTDVIMGNWLRSYTILVDPLDKKLSFVKTVQREIELFLLRKFQVSRS